MTYSYYQSKPIWRLCQLDEPWKPELPAIMTNRLHNLLYSTSLDTAAISSELSTLYLHRIFSILAQDDSAIDSTVFQRILTRVDWLLQQGARPYLHSAIIRAACAKLAWPDRYYLAYKDLPNHMFLDSFVMSAAALELYLSRLAVSALPISIGAVEEIGLARLLDLFLDSRPLYPASTAELAAKSNKLLLIIWQSLAFDRSQLVGRNMVGNGNLMALPRLREVLNLTSYHARALSQLLLGLNRRRLHERKNSSGRARDLVTPLSTQLIADINSQILARIRVLVLLRNSVRRYKASLWAPPQDDRRGGMYYYQVERDFYQHQAQLNQWKLACN